MGREQAHVAAAAELDEAPAVLARQRNVVVVQPPEAHPVISLKILGNQLLAGLGELVRLVAHRARHRGRVLGGEAPHGRARKVRDATA
ncbi:MAG TPA: hypothetical protein VKE22_10110 [Haliangiales bacterium]|nr:hypothetical protein [Haliangiales bacterium]